MGRGASRWRAGCAIRGGVASQLDLTGSSHRRRIAAAVAFAGVLLFAGCGLSAEKQPHEISDKAITKLISPVPNVSAPSTDGLELQAFVYFVRGDRLVQVGIPAGGDPVTPERALTLLLEGPPRTARGDLTTSIPPGTTLRGTSRAGSTLRIDLSGEIKSLGGTAAKAAYAQLVFTALRLSGVNSVRFAIDGENIDAITDDGSLTIIRANNYQFPLRPLR